MATIMLKFEDLDGNPWDEPTDAPTYKGCNCPDCVSASTGTDYPEFDPGPMSAPSNLSKAKKSKNMSQDAYNLARISRGEEGKTAYFLFDSVESMPEKILWLWEDGYETVHVKTTDKTKVQETTKDWWEKYVKGSAYPSNELIPDLYNDIFVNVQTETVRYQLVDKKKVNLILAEMWVKGFTQASRSYKEQLALKKKFEKDAEKSGSAVSGLKKVTAKKTTPKKVISGIQGNSVHYGIMDEAGKISPIANVELNDLKAFAGSPTNWTINVNGLTTGGEEAYKIITRLNYVKNPGKITMNPF